MADDDSFPSTWRIPRKVVEQVMKGFGYKIPAGFVPTNTLQAFAIEYKADVVDYHISWTYERSGVHATGCHIALRDLDAKATKNSVHYWFLGLESKDGKDLKINHITDQGMALSDLSAGVQALAPDEAGIAQLMAPLLNKLANNKDVKLEAAGIKAKELRKSMPEAKVPHGRVFASSDAHGGEAVDPATTALVMIEFQNEFATEKGKLHDGVKGNMKTTNMLANSVKVCDQARQLGMKVIHSPITFKEDMSDNPNRGQGILKGCSDGELFVEGTWGAKICEPMTPKEGDMILKGKHGLDAFPGSNLQELLVSNKIKTVVLGGFLTNCCVESTMRTAFEKGYNVITLTDCCATTSEEGHRAATEGTFGFFSTPMKAEAFISSAKTSVKTAEKPAEKATKPAEKQ